MNVRMACLDDNRINPNALCNLRIVGLSGYVRIRRYINGNPLIRLKIYAKYDPYSIAKLAF